MLGEHRHGHPHRNRDQQPQPHRQLHRQHRDHHGNGHPGQRRELHAHRHQHRRQRQVGGQLESPCLRSEPAEHDAGDRCGLPRHPVHDGASVEVAPLHRRPSVWIAGETLREQRESEVAVEVTGQHTLAEREVDERSTAARGEDHETKVHDQRRRPHHRQRSAECQQRQDRQLGRTGEDGERHDQPEGHRHALIHHRHSSDDAPHGDRNHHR